VSVLVLPYRHPLYWAKVAATIDVLSEGRFTLGVGVGWMNEEFDALNAPFAERGRLSDEQLELLRSALTDEHSSFAGAYYRFSDIAFYPNGFQRSHPPVWGGGEGTAAQRRAARYGDAWFPYFVRITPAELARRWRNVQRLAERVGRDPAEDALNLNLPAEVTDKPVGQRLDRLCGTPEQLSRSPEAFAELGVQHLALQFMVPHSPESIWQIQRFASVLLPSFLTFVPVTST